MEKVFENILDKNEQIIKVFKPNKLKFYLSTFLIYIFSTIWFFVPAILAVVELLMI